MSQIEALQSNVRQLEAQVLEMHKLKSAVERDLEAELILKEQKTKVVFHVIKNCVQMFLHTIKCVY